MRVLYVDDDRITTLLFEETCRHLGGVSLETAATGAEAMDLAASFAPDLLVIDLHLPDTDGYALLPALRRSLQAPSLPAFLCTADETTQVAEAALAAGYAGCWPKPASLDQLRCHLGAPDAAGP